MPHLCHWWYSNENTTNGINIVDCLRILSSDCYINPIAELIMLQELFFSFCKSAERVRPVPLNIIKTLA